ncbi:hypothetical protein Tco_1371447, partial [Tanacetum coccineum]
MKENLFNQNLIDIHDVENLSDKKLSREILSSNYCAQHVRDNEYCSLNERQTSSELRLPYPKNVIVGHDSAIRGCVAHNIGCGTYSGIPSTEYCVGTYERDSDCNTYIGLGTITQPFGKRCTLDFENAEVRAPYVGENAVVCGPSYPLYKKQILLNFENPKAHVSSVSDNLIRTSAISDPGQFGTHVTHQLDSDYVHQLPWIPTAANLVSDIATGMSHIVTDDYPHLIRCFLDICNEMSNADKCSFWNVEKEAQLNHYPSVLAANGLSTVPKVASDIGVTHAVGQHTMYPLTDLNFIVWTASVMHHKTYHTYFDENPSPSIVSIKRPPKGDNIKFRKRKKHLSGVTRFAYPLLDPNATSICSNVEYMDSQYSKHSDEERISSELSNRNIHQSFVISPITDKSLCDTEVMSHADKYVAEILKKFDFTSVKNASTPIETQKPLVKDEEATNVDVHLYRSMIGSLMYLTTSRPDIMFAGKPKLGLWYPRVSSFDLKSYSDSDYVGANLDKKSTTRGCQFLGRRLISRQCKKQTIVATLIQRQNMVDCCPTVVASFAALVKGRQDDLLYSLYGMLCEQKNLDNGDGTKELLLPDLFNFWLTKNDGNTEFHQFMDFLTHSSIHFALTVSPIVSTSFVEQFWTIAKSRTVNNISYIDAIVAGKPVTVLEASIRSDLLFDDADGIDTLNNQAIFNKALFSPQWKYLFHTMNHCISSKSTYWDQIPTNIATV